MFVTPVPSERPARRSSIGLLPSKSWRMRFVRQGTTDTLGPLLEPCSAPREKPLDSVTGLRRLGADCGPERCRFGEQCREPFVDLLWLTPAYTDCHRSSSDLPPIVVQLHRLTPDVA
jgi:hypothetical protein